MNGDDGHTFTEAYPTDCRTRELPSSDRIQCWCLKYFNGTLWRARGLGESDATMTCVPVNLRIRNAAITLTLSFSLSAADRHSQVIAAEALMSYGLGALPLCVGWWTSGRSPSKWPRESRQNGTSSFGASITICMRQQSQEGRIGRMHATCYS